MKSWLFVRSSWCPRFLGERDESEDFRISKDLGDFGRIRWECFLDVRFYPNFSWVCISEKQPIFPVGQQKRNFFFSTLKTPGKVPGRRDGPSQQFAKREVRQGCDCLDPQTPGAAGKLDAKLWHLQYQIFPINVITCNYYVSSEHQNTGCTVNLWLGNLNTTAALMIFAWQRTRARPLCSSLNRQPSPKTFRRFWRGATSDMLMNMLFQRWTVESQKFLWMLMINLFYFLLIPRLAKVFYFIFSWFLRHAADLSAENGRQLAMLLQDPSTGLASHRKGHLFSVSFFARQEMWKVCWKALALFFLFHFLLFSLNGGPMEMLDFNWWVNAIWMAVRWTATGLKADFQRSLDELQDLIACVDTVTLLIHFSEFLEKFQIWIISKNVE